jgi:hypothetical protein
MLDTGEWGAVSFAPDILGLDRATRLLLAPLDLAPLPLALFRAPVLALPPDPGRFGVLGDPGDDMITATRIIQNKTQVSERGLAFSLFRTMWNVVGQEIFINNGTEQMYCFISDTNGYERGIIIP